MLTDQTIQPGRQQLPLLLAALMLLAGAALVSLSDSNQALFLLLNQTSRLLPDAFWSNMTFVADTVFAVSCLLLAASFRPHLFAPALWLLILGTLYVHAGKAWFDVIRPAGILVPESFHIIGPELTRHAFPSGHSFTAMAFCSLLILEFSSRWLMPLLLLGLTAAFSRIAVGAHWPMDVLVGAAGGILMAWCCARLCQRWRWPNHSAIIWIGAILLTLGAIYTPIHEDRYPYTDVLAWFVACAALLAVVVRIWIPLLRGTKR